MQEKIDIRPQTQVDLYLKDGRVYLNAVIRNVFATPADDLVEVRADDGWTFTVGKSRILYALFPSTAMLDA